VRVLTWNLWWRFGDWQARRTAIGSVLRQADADVLTLQEVWADASENLAEALAADLGMHCSWSTFRAPRRWQERIGDDSVQVGTAILSRWPVAATADDVLPGGPDADDGRTVQLAEIDAPSGRLPVFTTHLDSAPGGSVTRCTQVAAMARFVARHSGSGLPPVVTGDLNAEPDSDEIRLLGGHLTAPAVPGLVLVDAWRWAEANDPGWTFDARNPYVAGVPSSRIDYVLLGLGARVTRIGLVGAGPVDGVWPSDHAGVVADLAQPQGSRPGWS
jgi:endonuclease/exonuclease/phosphatase family metal-dependent hydrolase